MANTKRKELIRWNYMTSRKRDISKSGSQIRNKNFMTVKN